MRRHLSLARLGLVIAAAFSLSVSLAAAVRADDTSGTAPLATPATPAPPAEKTLLSSAPDFTMEGVDGKSYHLQDLLKKGPVLMDFWATWCVPCLHELPKIEKIYGKYKDRGFTLLGVPCDDARTAAKIKPLIQSKGFKFPNVPDGEHKIVNMFNVRNFPTSILIAPDGHIVSVTQGYREGDEVTIEKAVAGLLPPAGQPTGDSQPAPQGGDAGSTH